MIADNRISQPADDDHDLRAFRYVADEMSADERVAFESLLETDQTARELVARMVGVVAQLCAAEDQVENAVESAGSHGLARPAAPIRRRSERRWSALAIVAAAAVVLAVGLHLVPLKHANRTGFANNSLSLEESAGDLVAYWSEWLTDSSTDSITENAPADNGAAESVPAESVAAADPNANTNAINSQSGPAADDAKVDDAKVPGWLLAAVSLDERTGPSSSSSETWEN